MENKEKCKIAIEKLTYRLEEMSDSMQQSVDNALSVKHEQVLLIDCLSTSAQADTFKDLIESCKLQIDELEKQITTLCIRKQLLDNVVNECKQNEKIENIVSTLLKALGVFASENDN